MSRNMCAAAVRPANMRRPEMHPTAAARPEAYSAAVPTKATVPSATGSATMSAAAAMSPAATMPAATAPATAGVCFECEKRHDDKQHRGNASAGRQHRLHDPAGLGASRRGRLSLAASPRTKSF